MEESCMKMNELEAMRREDLWKERMVDEYQELKKKYERLHRMLIKYECGTLDFQPNCSIELLRRQEYAMVEYLNVLETRAELEKVDIYGNE